MQRAEVDDARDLRSVGDRGADLRVVLRRNRLTDEQALHLDREHHRDDAEERADAEAPGCVPARLVGDLGQRDADEGDGEPDERAGVLEEDDRDLGILRVVDERPPRPALAHRERLASCSSKRQGLEHDRDAEDRVGHDR